MKTFENIMTGITVTAVVVFILCLMAIDNLSSGTCLGLILSGSWLLAIGLTAQETAGDDA